MTKYPSLYIHIPFCRRKCLYCSFVICVNRDKYIDEYLDCLDKEAQIYSGTKVKTIYIGGGTPSYLNVNQLDKLGKIIQKHYPHDKSAEFNIEANPEDITKDKLKILKQISVNRISLGVQSLNDKHLKYLGRNHDIKKAIKSFNLIREAGFNNTNIDLMFLFPKQTLAELKKDINDFIKLDSEHISTYALTIEENSRFFVGKEKLINNQAQAERYSFLVTMLEAGGLKQYEVSNFAKPKRESVHNINYWQEGEYIGLGLGAHSFLNGKRFWTTKIFRQYIDSIHKGESAIEGEEILTPYQQLKEAVLFGLRMNDGVNLELLEKRFQAKLTKQDCKYINDCIDAGLLEMGISNIKTSEKGRVVLDGICVGII